MNMSSKVKIICQTHDVQTNYKHGYTLVCPLKFEVGNFAFPHTSWDDFVVPVITDWVIQLCLKKLSIGKQRVLEFMEGSFAVYVTLINNEEVFLEFVKESVSKVVKLDETTTTYEELRNEVISVAKDLILTLQQNSIIDRDYEALVAVMKRVKEMKEK